MLEKSKPASAGKPEVNLEARVDSAAFENIGFIGDPSDS